MYTARGSNLTTTLVIGATGKTGRSLVEQLLGMDCNVRVIVRSPHKLGAETIQNPNTTVIDASVLDLTDAEMSEHVKDCDAVVSCLGHTLDFSGMFGQPRNLCTEAARRLCDAIEKNSPSTPTKFILMNTVGVRNADLDEKRAWFERCLLSVLRNAVPPHRDNETAAEHLQKNIGRQNKHIEWCSVRPISLIDADTSPYEIEESPTTGIFSGRPTTRSNVAHFMAALIRDPDLWSTWKFRMPVIMNCEESAKSSDSTSA
jgi:putative NADH-flavin reductase